MVSSKSSGSFNQPAATAPQSPRPHPCHCDCMLISNQRRGRAEEARHPRQHQDGLQMSSVQPGIQRQTGLGRARSSHARHTRKGR